jgi:acyl-CoA thioester hydrolase
VRQQRLAPRFVGELDHLGSAFEKVAEGAAGQRSRRDEAVPGGIDSNPVRPSVLLNVQDRELRRQVTGSRSARGPPQLDLGVVDRGSCHGVDRSRGATLSAVDGFPFVVPIQLRWRDVDALGHVNNATVVTYVETARTVLWREHFGGGSAIPFVVARLELSYRRQITIDDRVEVGLRVADLRGARFTFVYRIEANGELAADASTVMGHIQPGAIRPSRIPADLLEKLRSLQTESFNSQF